MAELKKYKVLRQVKIVKKAALEGSVVDLDPTFAEPRVRERFLIPCPEVDQDSDHGISATKKYKVIRSFALDMETFKVGSIAELEPAMAKRHMREGSLGEYVDSYASDADEHITAGSADPAPGDNKTGEDNIVTDDLIPTKSPPDPYGLDPLPPELAERLIGDAAVRREVTYRSHFLFFHCYLAHYVTLPTAPFQKELFRLTEDETVRNLFVVSFRDSGKSTILGLSLPLWSILGAPQKKFVIIFCQTQKQGKQEMKNIKAELETNALLRRDLWPFEDESDEWGSYALTFPKLNARIMVISSEQGMRGLRQRQYRPDLIILDDVEDVAGTRTHEGREKTWDWFTGDVIPAGDLHTRMVVTGTLLHEESLLMRIKNAVADGSMNGVFKEYPLINPDDSVAWPGKYPTHKELRMQRQKIGSEKAFQREFMLKIIAEENQVVAPEDIHYYDVENDLSDILAVCRCPMVTGVDLAISQKDSADYTALVTGKIIFPGGGNGKVFIMPNPVNVRLGFRDTVLQAQAIEHKYNNGWSYYFFVEKVGYQAAYTEELARHNINVIPMPPASDKRARFEIASQYIKDGTVLFPNVGCEDLIRQMVHFGVEAHEDLLDALVYLILGVMEENMLYMPKVVWTSS